LLTGYEVVASGMVLWGLLAIPVYFGLSRRRAPPPPTVRYPELVFLVPALDEALVITDTVLHLLEFPARHVVVIDDASSDDTAAQVLGIGDPRLVVVRRELPDARQGKGAALNAGYRWVRCELAGQDPSGVVVCVADADGRMKPGAFYEVASLFGDPGVGACQISVRIRNWRSNYWTRMQHFEFVSFTSIYQRARRHTGAVGLGGNGQFVRLSALMSLGDEPWSDCLTEDMDLGIRLIIAGWRNCYVPTSWVSQQAVPSVQRLLRQRTRWFQGALQCLRHVPAVASADHVPLITRIDLLCTLVAPLFLVFVSPLLLGGWVAFVVNLTGPGGPVHALASHPGIYLELYLVGFFPAQVLAFVFWVDEPDSSLVRAIVVGHQFTLYWYVWSVVGWTAVARAVARHRGWAKTARIDEIVIPGPVIDLRLATQEIDLTTGPVAVPLRERP
jgi:cellulose synthase/poly-beta-1,6-N-acetylglucosamine synthase-like glycosyltransferase